MARNRRHSPSYLGLAFAVSVFVHPAVAFIFDYSHEDPVPVLRVVVDGDGIGNVRSVPTGIECGTDGADCQLVKEPGSLIRLHASLGSNSTFVGWTGPCGSQAYQLFGWTHELLFSEAMVGESQPLNPLRRFLQEASEQPLPLDPLQCEVTLTGSVDISATFGIPPEEVEVAMLDDHPDNDEIRVVLPTAEEQPKERLKPSEEETPPIETSAESTPPPKPVVPEPSQMKSVELADENEVKTAPDDANYLSDKNRDVKDETRAAETNLAIASEGERTSSSANNNLGEEIGTEDTKIAEIDDQEAQSQGEEKSQVTPGAPKSAKMVAPSSGKDGKRGDDGESGNGTTSEDPGMLAMRNILGRGALGREGPGDRLLDDGETGAGGARGSRGRPGLPGPNLRLQQHDYERIVGTDVAAAEVAEAAVASERSGRRGRWERKKGLVKSALENFTPEVRTGNQTALKTRAAPFALYINRMHRKIHKHWGFGFLEGLDRKSASNPMNDMSLITNLEIVINKNGSIDKISIVKTSGLLTFDVAAMTSVDSGAPYKPTPEAIRSPDGKVYIHWSFHRGHRQCGTFNAKPFILSSVGKSRGQDDSKLLRKSTGK